MRKVIFNDGSELDIVGLSHALRNGREWKTIELAADFATVAEKFQDGISWSHSWDSLFIDEAGKETTEIYTEDCSEFSVRGDIVAHADGTITVYMGKPTEVEILQAVVDELVLASLGGAE